MDSQARALEAMDYVVATMHMQGFARMFRPTNFTPNPADEETVKERGKEIFEKGFGVMDKALAGKEYVVGGFSIADAALFYVEFWAAEAHEDDTAAQLRRALYRMRGASRGAAGDAAGRPGVR